MNNIINRIIIYILTITIFVGCTTQNQYFSSQSTTKSKSYYINDSQPNNKINATSQAQNNISILNNNLPQQEAIAMVVASGTIGRYAIDAINSLNNYLLYTKQPFYLKVFDMKIQNKKNILKIFKKMSEENISKAIIMTTKSSLNTILSISNINNMKLYLPLINKDELTTTINNNNIIFGAISYKNQFKALTTYAHTNKLVDLYDNSSLGYELHKYMKQYKLKYSKKVSDKNSRYKRFLQYNSKIQNSTLFLNTPIVKSSILLSTISGLQHLNVYEILSTQLNYTPLLFKLTQKLDRKKLIVANSIGRLPKNLEEYNILFHTNLKYNWVNFSTIVGIQYLINQNIDIFTDLKIINNQVHYPVYLYKVGNNSFSLIKQY